MVKNDLIRDIRWLGHAGIFIDAKPSIYINPYDLAFPTIGDLILITSDDDYICVPDEVKWLRKGSTVIIVPPECVDQFSGGDIHPAVPGNTLKVKGATIDILPAFVDKKAYKDNNLTGIGYIITYPDGRRIFYSGHTLSINDLHPKSIDVLIIPVIDQFNEDLNLFIDLINQVNPKVVVPIDWKSGLTLKNKFININERTKSELAILKPKR